MLRTLRICRRTQAPTVPAEQKLLAMQSIKEA